MGLRSLVKNSGSGAGLQGVSAEEASAQGAATLSQAADATGLSPATTALGATQQGASPAAAKMVGTPNHQASSMRSAVRSIADAKSEGQLQSDAMAALQKDPVRAEAMARLARLPGMVDLISKRVQEQALKSTSPLGDANWQEPALLSAAGGDPAKAAALKADIQKLTSNAKPDVATVNRLMTALGVKDASGLQGKLGEMVKGIDPSALSRALMNGMGSSEQAIAALDDADAKVLGYGSLDAMKAEVEKLTGKPFAGLKVSDVLSAVEGNKKAAFADVAQLRSTLSDPTTSAAQKVAAAEAMRRLGYDSGLAQEQRAGDIQAQVQAGDSVRIGKITASIDQISKDPTLLADVQRVLTDPEYRAELLAQDPIGNKPYVDWALKNATSLEPYIAKAQDDIDAQVAVQKTVAARYGPIMADPNANMVFKALGIDLSKLHDADVGLTNLPPLASALFRASMAASRTDGSTTQMAESRRVFTNMSALIPLLQDSGDPRFKNVARIPPSLLTELAKMPGGDVKSNFDAWLSLDRASSVYANAAPAAARPVLPRQPVLSSRGGNPVEVARGLQEFSKAMKQYEKDSQKYNADMAVWTRGNNSRNAVVSGAAGPGAVAAVAKGMLTDPDYAGPIQAFIKPPIMSPEDAGAFKNADTLQNHMNMLAKVASGGGTLAEKIAAQKRLQTMGAALAKMDPNSEEFKGRKDTGNKVRSKAEMDALLGTGKIDPKSSFTSKALDQEMKALMGGGTSAGIHIPGVGTKPRERVILDAAPGIDQLMVKELKEIKSLQAQGSADPQIKAMIAAKFKTYERRRHLANQLVAIYNSPSQGGGRPTPSASYVAAFNAAFPF